MLYTDGSFKEGTSGSGAVVYRHFNKKIKEISVPTGLTSIIYAELYAIYSALRWFLNSNVVLSRDVHFFVDNKYVTDILTAPNLPKDYFYLIQDIKQLATVLGGSHGYELLS